MLLCALGGSILSTPAFATEPPVFTVTLRPDQARVVALPDVLKDPHNNLTIQQVSRPPFQDRFVRLTTAQLANYAGAFWIRFRIARRPGDDRALFLQTFSDEAELYVPQRDGTYRLVRLGMAQPFVGRPFPSIVPAVELDASMTGTTLYMRKTIEFLPPTIWIQTAAQLYNRDAWHYLYLGLFVGFFIAIGISSFLLAFYLRESAYVYNALMMLCQAVLQLIDNHVAGRFFWPHATLSDIWPDTIANATYFVCLVAFARAFLETPVHAPRLDKAIIAGLAVTVVMDFSGTAFPNLWFFNSAQPAIQVLNVILTYAFLPPLAGAAMVALQRGGRNARFFTLGFVGLSTGFVVNLMSLLDMLPRTEFTHYIYVLGIAFDASMFQLALADRALAERRRAAEAQTQRADAQEQLLAERAATVERLEVYNRAFGRFVPREFLAELERSDVTTLALGDHVEREMTILFCDIRSFTTLCETMTPRETFEFLNAYLGRVGPVVRENGGFIDKYVGDAVMALFPGTGERAFAAAVALQQEVRRFNQTRARASRAPIAVGIGLHRGTLMLGTIGETERYDTTVIADAVNVASRCEGLTKTFGAAIITSGECLTSIDRPESYRTRRLGRVQVKGTHRPLDIFELCDADLPELLLHKIATRTAFENAVAAYGRGHFIEAYDEFSAIAEADAHDLPAAYFRDRCIAMRDALNVVAWDGIERIEK